MQALLKSALHSEWLASLPVCCTDRNKTPHIHFDIGLGRPQPGLDIVGKRKCGPCRNQLPNPRLFYRSILSIMPKIFGLHDDDYDDDDDNNNNNNALHTQNSPRIILNFTYL